MTDTKTLIEEARDYAGADEYAGATLIRDLADALEAAEQRADALAAVVEAIRSWFDEYNGEEPGVGGWYALEVNLEVTPTTALREHDARVWDEGFDRGFYSGQAMPEDSDASESPVCNPYQREEQDA